MEMRIASLENFHRFHRLRINNDENIRKIFKWNLPCSLPSIGILKSLVSFLLFISSCVALATWELNCTVLRSVPIKTPVDLAIFCWNISSKKQNYTIKPLLWLMISGIYQDYLTHWNWMMLYLHFEIVQIQFADHVLIHAVNKFRNKQISINDILLCQICIKFDRV